MTDLHYLFRLRHPRRFWWSSLAIAIACALLLGPWLDSTPWLVAIPLVAGGLLVALGELWDEILPHGSGNGQAHCRRP
ncbi:MAG: hypothetical protein RR376_04140 [Janthinobacterium sp.]|jgi:hypothetical protein